MSTKSSLRTKATLPDELHIFLPAVRSVICVLIVLGGMLAVGSYFAIVHGGLFSWGAILLLGFLFTFLAFPVLRNPKLMVSGENLCLFSFGRGQGINFSNHLIEIVEREGKIVSYRFMCEGKHFQISPDSYNDSEELQRQFVELMKTRKLNVSAIFRYLILGFESVKAVRKKSRDSILFADMRSHRATGKSNLARLVLCGPLTMRRAIPECKEIVLPHSGYSSPTGIAAESTVVKDN